MPRDGSSVPGSWKVEAALSEQSEESDRDEWSTSKEADLTSPESF